MANSIKTNFSAMTALQSLNMTNKNLEKTQSRISTGFKVNEAADNAAYWAISQTLRSDNSSLATVQDSLGLGAGLVDVAYTGLTEAKGVVDNIRNKLLSARQDGIDKGLIELDIDKLQERLKDIAKGSAYSGQNWLVAEAGATTAIVSNYSRQSDGTAVVGTIAINFDSVALFADVEAGTGGMLESIAAIDDIANMDSAELEAAIADATSALDSIVEAATNLGSVKSQINSQQDFVKNLRDAIDRGISSLVDADMNEESTRLQALQVQQQLGVQALSIANQSSQSLLRLFQ